ncbi:TonB-dependent receptor [Steroidobacter denitrificans]|uniref:TonB-dependent receptor n=1 Tax=Steroidobacter denitrificans TaxID=465721 RepID=A0A127FC74_STEDE|nr:TonB-dependent siderophore receptor [Steroidobacter denitrificans]AMN48007.1 TonB-dependent receptor [Steroidobacter denitrificans]
MKSMHPTARTHRLLLSFVVGTALAPAAYAAEAPPTTTLPTVRAIAEPDAYSASAADAMKTNTPLRDVPQSVSVITRKSIDDLNMQNIGDAVVYVPGVVMAQGEGNRETPVIRGVSSTGDFFLDGLRDDVQYYRDLYNIAQVEVLKGPNGMLFGRGGTGGLINRVTKQADWQEVRALTLQGGSNSNKRITLDAGQGLNESVAFRVNGLYEDSDSYRDDVTLKRYGINPTLSFKAGENTTISLGVEYFHDERVADRGISSYLGRPLDLDPGTFIGDPDQSPTESTVKSSNALIEHRFSDDMVLRNRTRYADYDKFYQNVFAGAVNTAAVAGNPPGTMVAIVAYNSATQRQNFFNQTDLNFSVTTGVIRHNLLTGIELGRQDTKNFRNTGYFDGVAPGTTSITVPVNNPRTTQPVTWRQSATDADNDGTAKIIALYAQDEIVLSPRWQVIAGLRFDNFKVDLTNKRTAARFDSKDNLLSPRLALVHKPLEALSLYASYGLTYQPRAGDQLASLSASNASLDPEEFTNYEIGAKWDALPALSLSAALFRLERSNIAVADPQAGEPGGPPPGTMILVKGQRNRGIELGATGAVTNQWSLIGSFAYQEGEVTHDQSATILKGAHLGALPKATFSLWNRYDFSSMWGIGVGVIHKDDVFASTQNLASPAINVKLPSYTRVDAAAFFTFSERLRAQVNIENLLDKDYYVFANSNNNITPGSPRAFRVTLTASF